jgi:hypothetical protein
MNETLHFADLRPTVVLADSSPLIHLAAIDRLDLLAAMGRVVVVDVVRLETCFDLTKPYAPEISAWLKANAATIDLVDTDLGPLYEHALKYGLKPPRNSGERAIVDWLAENIVHAGGPALVIYENGKVPNMLRREGLPEDVVVMTSHYFLRLAQHRGLVTDADQLWAEIENIDHRANPQAEATIIQRTM